MARNPLSPYRGSMLGSGFDPLFSLHREMNRLFDEVMGGGLPVSGGQNSGNIINANMNVSETEHEIRISAEMPGVNEQDIDVSLNDDVLTIRGEKRMERTNEKENFHFVERSYGTFQRSVRLPFSVDPEQVRASFENGVLTVTLPKSAQQERTRRIQVQRGATGRQGAQMLQSARGQGGPDMHQSGLGSQGEGDQIQAGGQADAGQLSGGR